MSGFTATRVLLNKCKWLRVKQLVFYHRVLTTHKIVKNRAPMYLYNKMNYSHPYETAGYRGAPLNSLGSRATFLETAFAVVGH